VAQRFSQKRVASQLLVASSALTKRFSLEEGLPAHSIDSFVNAFAERPGEPLPTLVWSKNRCISVIAGAKNFFTHIVQEKAVGAHPSPVEILRHRVPASGPVSTTDPGNPPWSLFQQTIAFGAIGSPIEFAKHPRFRRAQTL